MKNEIIISAVSYLNTKPFIYGIEHSGLLSNYRLELDYPAICSEKLIQGTADMGLVPVASIPFIPHVEIISDFCIGAENKVGSVLLLSQVPLKEIKNIYLDYQSNTSVMLAQVLAEKYWKVNVHWLEGKKGYEEFIRGENAGIIIGDRAFEYKDKFAYRYDLSEEWRKFTGTPFTFALWVANKKIDSGFLQAFNKSLEFGTEHVNEVLQALRKDKILIPGAESYFRNNISYRYDEAKKEGIGLFFKYMQEVASRVLRQAQQGPSATQTERI